MSHVGKRKKNEEGGGKQVNWRRREEIKGKLEGGEIEKY